MSTKPTEQPKTVRLQVTCANLRHKLMYVEEEHAVPGYVDPHSDTRVFWCERSQTDHGPDGQAVDPDTCSMGRRCFEP